MLLATVFLLIGFVLLVFAADYLVKGAANIATAVGISPLVVGLTVVAFGTSAPELAVSVASAYKDQADLAVGNVIGSNIFNILVILGISAMIIPLAVNRQLIKFDVPVMIFLSVLLFVLSLDGEVSRWDGVILFSMAVVYTSVLIWHSRRTGDSVLSAEVKEQIEGSKAERKLWRDILFVVLGIAGLTAGSHLLVKGAVEIATFFGVSELIIGLTIISVGTSLPEVATSVMAAVKGERDIAVGNVVGSNIFNIVSVLGLASIVAPSGIGVPAAALRLDMPFMIMIAIAAFPVFLYKYTVGRVSGFFFFAFYLAYLAYLILEARGSDVLGGYHHVLIYYVLPAAGVCLLALLARAIFQPKNLA